MNLGDKLKSRRTEIGLTQEQVAEIVGVTKGTVAKWESGFIENMKRDKIVLLAKALQVSPAFIMEWDNVVDIAPFNPHHRIPILGQISAGLPLYAEQHILGYTMTELNGGAEYFALKVKGDSMNAARINDGDILIVRRQEIVENGEIAVVMVDRENATVKRFRRNGNTVVLYPQSNNPKHKPQMYDLRKTEVRVLGKVVRIQIDVDSFIG